METLGAVDHVVGSIMSDCGEDPDALTVYQGKVIVLGDAGSGKSSLVKSLDPIISSEKSAMNSSKVDVFSVVEMMAQELKFEGKLLLKIWEYSGKDDPIVFEGALFVIIAVDLRSPESAYSAFSKWTALREKYMNESHLIVVGNFVDAAVERRVDVSEISQACEENDAIYVEVSNLTNVNIQLFRSIIAHQAGDILRKRPQIFGMIENAEQNMKLNTEDLFRFNEKAESDTMGMGSSAEEAENKPEISYPVSAPFLEKDLLLGSVGSILASAAGTEYWPGYENEKEDLQDLGVMTLDYIDRLGQGAEIFIPREPFEYSFKTKKNTTKAQGNGNGSGSSDEFGIDNGVHDDSIIEAKEAFEIMGFSLPEHLFSSETLQVPVKAKVTKKLKITLPNKKMGHLTLKEGESIEDQVDAFLQIHDMADDFVNREKILGICKSVNEKSSASKN